MECALLVAGQEARGNGEVEQGLLGHIRFQAEPPSHLAPAAFAIRHFEHAEVQALDVVRILAEDLPIPLVVRVAHPADDAPAFVDGVLGLGVERRGRGVHADLIGPGGERVPIRRRHRQIAVRQRGDVSPEERVLQVLLQEEGAHHPLEAAIGRGGELNLLHAGFGSDVVAALRVRQPGEVAVRPAVLAVVHVGDVQFQVREVQPEVQLKRVGGLLQCALRHRVVGDEVWGTRDGLRSVQARRGDHVEAGAGAPAGAGAFVRTADARAHHAGHAVGHARAQVYGNALDVVAEVPIAVGVVVPLLQAQIHVEPVRGGERQLRPNIGGVRILHAAPVADGEVLDIGIAGVLHRGHPQCRLVAEGQVDEAFAARPRIVAGRQRHAVVRLLRIRPVADDMHQAAEGVAPEERALRAAQHLHPVHVHEAGQGLGMPGAVDAVRIEGDRHVVGLDLLRARAAHRRPRVGAGQSDLQAWRDGVQPEEVVDAKRPEILAGDGRDGHRDVLHIGGAPGGRDQDFLADHVASDDAAGNVHGVFVFRRRLRLLRPQVQRRGEQGQGKGPPPELPVLCGHVDCPSLFVARSPFAHRRLTDKRGRTILPKRPPNNLL